MNNDAKKFIDRLAREHSLSKEDYAFLVRAQDEETAAYAGALAAGVRREVYGTDVYIRGLIEIGNICRMLLPFEDRLLGYELLRFHTLGFDKFAACGMKNPLAGARELSKERFETLRSFAKSILKITK